VDTNPRLERISHAARMDETGNASNLLSKILLISKLIMLINILFLKIVTLPSTHRINSRMSKDLEKLMSAANETSAAVRTQDFSIALKRGAYTDPEKHNFPFALFIGPLSSKVLKMEHIMDSVVK
jgi:hypothetical protein